MINKENFLIMLEKKNIEYSEFSHEAVFRVKDSIEVTKNIPGLHTKNLFLKNKKGDFCLLSCINSTKVDIKKFSKKNNYGNLSFANALHLEDLMGIKPGSVCPFGLLNDKENKIKFFLDHLILESSRVNFHPLINKSTVSMNTKDFINFMVENKKIVNIYNFTNHKIL